MAVLQYPGLQKYDNEIKNFVANHYEPKIQSEISPLYSAIIAEDTPVTADNPYVIDIGDNEYQELCVFIVIPNAGGANTSCPIWGIDAEGNAARCSIELSRESTGAWQCVRFGLFAGRLHATRSWGTTNVAIGQIFEYPQESYSPAAPGGFSGIQIYPVVGTATILAETQITVYGSRNV